MKDGRFLSEGVGVKGDPSIWAAAQEGKPGYKGILAQTLPENTEGGTKGRVLATGPGVALLESEAMNVANGLVDAGLVKGFQVDLGKEGKIVLIEKDKA